jgi:ribonuclease Z
LKRVTKLKIRFLGNWSSILDRGKRHISFVVDDKFVFDFGPHTVESILESNINPAKISTIYISHLHLDHYSGLAELLWHRASKNVKSKLTIVGPKGLNENMRLLLRALNTPPEWYKLTDSTTEYIEDTGTELAQIFRGNHTIMDFGYRFTFEDSTIFYSGDTAYCEEMVEGARSADCLIHEMTYRDEDEKLARHWLHSTYSDTIRVFQESGAKKLIPVHLSTKSNQLALKLARENRHIIYPKVGSIITI